MDLHWIGAEPTDAERSAVDDVVGPPEGNDLPGADLEEHVVRGGLAEALSKRHLLLPALNAVQGRVGSVSPGALDYICRRLTIPPAEAYGVATFYALLATERRQPRVAHVCDDIACQLAGAEGLCRDLEATLGPEGGAWFRSPCLGQCERAPAALLQLAGEDDWTLTSASAATVADALAGKRSESPLPSAAPQTRSPRAEGLRILRRVGGASPSSIDDYREQGGYRALRRAFELGPEGVIREVKESGIRGRGGAAFPMGVKWEAVAKAPVQPHYVVCNADESEPGTFKDRLLMEEDPFAVIEATTIAGYATGAGKGYIYVRGEYPLAIRRLRQAAAIAEKRGFLGAGVMGEGFDFEIEVRQGAGAYICGEETALFNSIEGYRGEPRSKPPFPTQVGLFRKPTVVNNVETLVNVLDIVLDGGPAFAAIGTKESAGPKLFCLSGHVARPGVYEVPFGATLREVIDLAG
ncbi:MAG TPA: NAD(P)H-dependent oxidoreductase subunit E, partial [Vicinamibacteria bacterium]